MKPELQAKYLQFISSKKNKEEGFTLIELLVVVIIIGVLAAVALPNLLGQVGKARETEGKNGVGSVNRAQQSYHFEKAAWSGPLTNAELQANNVLGVIIPLSKYYSFTIAGATNATVTTVTALGMSNAASPVVDNGKSQGTRDYSGAIDFVAASGTYNQIICQANVSGTIAGAVPTNTSTCAANHTVVK